MNTKVMNVHLFFLRNCCMSERTTAAFSHEQVTWSVGRIHWHMDWQIYTWLVHEHARLFVSSFIEKFLCTSERTNFVNELFLNVRTLFITSSDLDMSSSHYQIHDLNNRNSEDLRLICLSVCMCISEHTVLLRGKDDSK